MRKLSFVLVAALALSGCGRAGRDAARQQIKQARQNLDADDFLKAARAGDQAMVETFLRAGIDRNIHDAHGTTALMAAAVAGKPGIVKTLLDENAKPNLQDMDGNTALILAAEADQPGSVRALIEGNADPRVKGQQNFTPLMKAVYLGRQKVVDVLLETSRDQLARDGQLDRALAVASLLGNNDLVRALLDHGAGVNTALDKKQTPLMFAATTGKGDTAQLLLQRGADPKLVNADGATASILALQAGFPAVARLIDASTPGGVPPPLVAGGGVSPSPSPAAVPPEVAADQASAARERTWLKEQGIEPVKLLGADTGQDSDRDGFTDDQETAAGTDPNNADSHPPQYAKLRMKQFHGDPFPVMFDRSDGKKAEVTVRGGDGAERKASLAKGERVPDLPYKVAGIRARNVTEKDSGKPVDASELTLANVDTGEKIVLVRAMPSAGPNASAVLSVGGDAPDITVKTGQKFTLPQDDRTTLQVLDIRPTQVVLKALDTGRTVTVTLPSE